MNRVVVIGGGASGVLAAVALAGRRAIERITVVERADRVGPGLAYGAAEPHHLLNSPAGKMSAVHGDDDHLLAWCRDRGLNPAASDFLPRRLYGDYLAAVFEDLVAAEAGRVERVRAEAVAVDPGERTAVVRLDDGGAIEADRVVLALGNPPPLGRGAAAGVRSVPDPWAPGALDEVAGGRVLLLGTGLTMVDVATRLARRDDRVRLTATSRALLLPRVHLETPAPPGPGLQPRGTSLGAVLSAFGERLRAARSEGRPWQAEVDGVRPQINDLWGAFSPVDRSRFVERVSRRWEVHRHRMAPAVAAELDALRGSGRLVLAPARDARGFDAVVDCTGPRPAAAVGWSPVVDGLLQAGSARPEALGIGLAIDPVGALLDTRSRPSSTVFLLGPARRGTQWECTAVPEVRQHADSLAALFATAEESEGPSMSEADGNMRSTSRVAP